MNVVLDDPLVKKHLCHFRWSEGVDGLRITYDFLDYVTLCEVVGCVVLGDNPVFGLGVGEDVVGCVHEVMSLPLVERRLIVELFEYFECECPRKIVKRVLDEFVSG